MANVRDGPHLKKVTSVKITLPLVGRNPSNNYYPSQSGDGTPLKWKSGDFDHHLYLWLRLAEKIPI